MDTPRQIVIVGGGFAGTTLARALAANLLARIEGRPTRPFGHVSKGMMATTGHLKGVAQLGGIGLAGLPAWLLWRAYDLMRMPTFGRKVRIWVEWTWGMFFAADITHLRFTRTAEVDAPPPTVSPLQPWDPPCSRTSPPSSPARPAASAWASRAPSRSAVPT